MKGGEELQLWVCMWPDFREISGPLHANMCLIQSHYQTTNLKHNSQWDWVWSCTCARSPVPTHNRCVPASGVRVQPECRCASRGRPQLHFGRLGTGCWAARSPPMHEQKRRDESRGPGNQHDLVMDGTGGHFTGYLSFQCKYCLKYPITQSCFIT